MLTRGGLADEKFFFAVTTNCKKSAEAIVARKLVKGRTIISPK